MRFDSLHRQKRRTGALRNGRLGMQNARAGIPNRVAQGIRTGGGSWPHTGIVGATSGIAPGGTPASAIKPWLRSAVGERGKWSGRRRGAFSGTKPERNARRRAADGSPPLLRSCTMQARDERAVCEANRALVTADSIRLGICSNAPSQFRKRISFFGFRLARNCQKTHSAENHLNHGKNC